MEVRVDGKKYHVAFSHVRAFESKKSKKLVPIGTRCVITRQEGKGSITISTSETRTAHGDQFNKAVGRRLALQKALNVVWPESKVTHDPVNGRVAKVAPPKVRETQRATRTKFWKTYFDTVEANKDEE